MEPHEKEAAKEPEDLNCLMMKIMKGFRILGMDSEKQDLSKNYIFILVKIESIYSFLTAELVQEARAAGERTKALEAEKKKVLSLKTPTGSQVDRRTKRELFCDENLQELEESLLSSEEPSVAEGARLNLDDARVDAADEDAALDGETGEAAINFMEE